MQRPSLSEPAWTPLSLQGAEAALEAFQDLVVADGPVAPVRGIRQRLY
jgi:hypothetical protein